MKKIVVFLSVFLMCLSVEIFANSKASVVSVSGKVEVRRNNAWVPLSAGDSVSEGELLNTGFKSEAVIKYEGSVMKMGPMTRITLEKLSSTEQKDTVSVYLKTGALRSTVSHAKRKTQQSTRSATAVASVRGTDYLMTSAGYLHVNEGGVSFSPANMVSAASLGITNPADGQEGANKEKTDEVENTLPVDGESNPNTAISDVNPNIQEGVLVAAGYTLDLSSGDGFTQSRGQSTFASNAREHSSYFENDGSERVSTSDSLSFGSVTNSSNVANSSSEKSNLEIVVGIDW